MATGLAPPAVKRLQQDFMQLRRDPIVGANAQPLGDNMMTWYGIVIPPEGSSLAGIPIRFCLEFTNDYPNTPPSAYFETFIAYRAGVTYHDRKGRIFVCLNLFASGEHGYTSEGWSPSYTVSTMLVSMQALMMGDGEMLSNRLEDIKRTIDSALSFRCETTKHVGSDERSWFPKVIRNAEVAAMIKAKYPTGKQTVLDTFYICYADGYKTGANSFLGYGISIEGNKNKTISSPCEYLSYTSFTQRCIRRSSTNIHFDYWLPILIKAQDWDREGGIKSQFIYRRDQICKEINFSGSHWGKTFKICSSLMNSLVVQMMENGKDVSANDKFINAYFAIYRLLSQHTKDCKATKEADRMIQKFKGSRDSRDKKVVPNLGEFLIYLTISEKYGWDSLSAAFMEECDARNYNWYFSRMNASNHLNSKSRCDFVFDATSVSRHLVMFQVRFATVAANLKESGLLELEDENYGLAPEGLRAELKQLFKTVTEIGTWNDYFSFLNMPSKTVETRAKELIDAETLSLAKGYHGRPRTTQLNRYLQY